MKYEEFLVQGFTPVKSRRSQLEGYSILQGNGSHIAFSPDGTRSAFLDNLKQAEKWIEHFHFAHSKTFPNVGELWSYEGRTAIICGNSVSEDGNIGVMDWNSGEKADAIVKRLIARADRKSLTEPMIVERFTEWARTGNGDAIWWLAWWYEGKNHPRSVWYYIAAMRRDPKHFGWALSRVCSDAKAAYMCDGIPKPDLAFLRGIPEIQTGQIGNDWLSAVNHAVGENHTR